MGCHHGGAGTGAAGQRGASTPFPNAHLQLIRGMHLHEMNIGAGREGWVLFQGRAETLKVH